jgi:CheY-like chemotaxis protein
MKILIIEDDPTNLKLVKIILSSEGHTIFEAGRGDTALEMIKDEKPDLILLDLILPDMSGTALAAQLKDDEATSGIPIVAITGYPYMFGNKEVVSSGIAAYIVKPINTRDLLETIEGYMPRHTA